MYAGPRSRHNWLRKSLVAGKWHIDQYYARSREETEGESGQRRRRMDASR